MIFPAGAVLGEVCFLWLQVIQEEEIQMMILRACTRIASTVTLKEGRKG